MLGGYFMFGHNIGINGRDAVGMQSITMDPFLLAAGERCMDQMSCFKTGHRKSRLGSLNLGSKPCKTPRLRDCPHTHISPLLRPTLHLQRPALKLRSASDFLHASNFFILYDSKSA